MKKIFSFCFFILFTTVIHAQVYEFYPNYTYASDEFTEYKSLVPKKADTTYAWFKFDLDAKMITCQLAPDGELQNLPIKKIKIKDNVIDLALEPYKNIEKTVGYKLTLQNSQVLYCQHYVTYSGVTKTIGYQNYISDLKYVAFHMESYAFISDKNMNGNLEKVKDIAGSDMDKYTFTPTSIDMHDGKITFKQGKGKTTQTQVYDLSEVKTREDGFTMSSLVPGATIIYAFIYQTSTIYPYPNDVSFLMFDYNAEDPGKSVIREYTLYR